MKLVKDLFKKIKKIFYIKNKPIGLKALGVKLNYLGTFYSFNYSTYNTDPSLPLHTTFIILSLQQ